MESNKLRGMSRSSTKGQAASDLRKLNRTPHIALIEKINGISRVINYISQSVRTIQKAWLRIDRSRQRSRGRRP